MLGFVNNRMVAINKEESLFFKGIPNNQNNIILGSPSGGISIAARIEDPIFNSAKSMFLRYAKQQHKSIINIAKRELENIKNNTYSACENNDLESFRIFPKRVRVAVLISIIAEFD